jgi:hypothetical protein
MTTFNRFQDVVRDGQDSTERHVYKKLTISSKGASVTVKGNDTEDEDVPVLAIGGFLPNLPEDTDAEIILLGAGNDTTAKMAIITPPRDKIYESKPGQSWGQNPLDKNERMGYTEKGVRVASKSFATWNGTMEVIEQGGQKIIYLRADQIISNVPITIGTPPGFERE